MKKMLKLVCLSLLALTVAGCGKKVLVPEKTIVAAYVDLEKTYDNGKSVAETLLDALPSKEKDAAKSAYEEALKKIDKFKEKVDVEWAVISFGGDLKSLARHPENNVAVVIKVSTDEAAFKDVVKDIVGGDLDPEKKGDNIVYEMGNARMGLLDEKYVIFSPSKDAFEDMFDLYDGKGKASDDFGDLAKISGDTICRISTAPISSLLKRFELTKYIEKFGEACEDKELVDMILNMGAISLDVKVGDELGLALNVNCDSSSDAKIIESLMRSLAFLGRVGCDAGAFGASNPDLLGSLRASRSEKSAIVGAKDLFVSLAKKIEADRSGSVATLSVTLETEQVADFVKKVAEGENSRRSRDDD